MTDTLCCSQSSTGLGPSSQPPSPQDQSSATCSGIIHILSGLNFQSQSRGSAWPVSTGPTVKASAARSHPTGLVSAPRQGAEEKGRDTQGLTHSRCLVNASPWCHSETDDRGHDLGTHRAPKLTEKLPSDTTLPRVIVRDICR